MVKSKTRRAVVDYLKSTYKIGTKRACKVVRVNRSGYYYKASSQPFNTALTIRIKEIAAARIRFGYRRIHVLLKREGYEINHKRVARLYRSCGLALRLTDSRKRKSVQLRERHPSVTGLNQRWAMDFMHDRLSDGRVIRFLTVVDTFSREGLALHVNWRLKARDVIQVLDNICRQRGTPVVINCDNGPEFISLELDLWAQRNHVQLDFSRPGKPTDNAFIESFNGRVRQEFLNTNWFASLEETRVLAAEWLHDYNAERPHRALANLTPRAYAQSYFELQST